MIHLWHEGDQYSHELRNEVAQFVGGVWVLARTPRAL
jgi:hypothetical protein